MSIVLALALLLGGCAPPPATSPGAPPGPTAQPESAAALRWRRSGPQGNGASTGQLIRLGAALSLSGSGAAAGLAQRAGLRLAQDEINASHLLGTARLDIVVEDDASDRDQAASVFQKFIDNSHVVGIIGPTLNDVALSVDPLAQQAGVPVLAISNPAGSLTQIGNFIFRDALSESQLAPATIKQVCARLKLHKAALLYSDTDANRSGSHGFKKALQDTGVRIVAEQAFEPGATDFSGPLEEIAASRPDALFVTATGSAAAPILIQARQSGLAGVPIVGSNAFNSASVLKTAGEAANGLIVGSGWSSTMPSPRNQQFIQGYRDRYGSDPDQFAAQAYSGVYILAAAIGDVMATAAGQPPDPRLLRDALERVHGLDTPLGVFSFNDAHDAVLPPTVQIVRDGALQPF